MSFLRLNDIESVTSQLLWLIKLQVVSSCVIIRTFCLLHWYRLSLLEWKPIRMPIKCVTDTTKNSKIAWFFAWFFWFLLLDLNNDLNQSTLARSIIKSVLTGFKLSQNIWSRRDSKFGQTCRELDLADDCSFGYVVTEWLQVPLTESLLLHSHLEQMNAIPPEDLTKQVIFIRTWCPSSILVPLISYVNV